jgi:hypothetical protein
MLNRIAAAQNYTTKEGFSMRSVALKALAVGLASLMLMFSGSISTVWAGPSHSVPGQSGPSGGVQFPTPFIISITGLLIDKVTDCATGAVIPPEKLTAEFVFRNGAHPPFQLSQLEKIIIKAEGYQPKEITSFMTMQFQLGPLRLIFIIPLERTICLPPLSPPDIDVSPTSIDFGAVAVGTTAARQLTIRNVGQADLFVSSITIQGGPTSPFHFGGVIFTGFTLRPGQGVTIQVFFTPRTTGLFQDAVIIQSNDPDESTVVVPLRGGFGKLIGFKFEDLNGNGQWEREREPGIAGWRITLTGPESQTTTTDANGRFEFTIRTPGTYTVSEETRAGWRATTATSVSVTVRLIPGETFAEILFGNRRPQPDIEVRPLVLNFGIVKFGITPPPSLPFTIQNVGDADLVVNSVTIRGGVSSPFDFCGLVFTGFTLRPGEARTLRVCFSPKTVGPVLDEVLIQSNDPDEATEVVVLLGDVERNIQVCLKEVSFEGDHTIVVDSDNFRNIADPIWTDNNCDKTAEKNEPVAYTRGRGMKIKATLEIKINPPLAEAKKVRITAFDRESGYLFTRLIELNGAGGTIVFEAESLDNLENKVHYLGQLAGATLKPGLNLKWRIDDQQFGESQHLVYVTLRDPTTTVYLTLLDLTVRNANGESDEAEVVKKIWEEFTDRKVHRRTLNGQTGEVTPEADPMSYWKPGTCPTPNSCPSPINPLGQRSCVFTTEGVLRHKDGRCGGWANFFKDSLAIHGIGSTIVTVQHVSSGALLLVSNWTFVGNGNSGDSNWPWKFVIKYDSTGSSGKFLTNDQGSEVRDDPGIPAQGNDDPQAIFTNHAIVEYNGKLYDPSYGTGPFNNCKAWEDASMANGGYLDPSKTKAKKDDPNQAEVTCN